MMRQCACSGLRIGQALCTLFTWRVLILLVLLGSCVEMADDMRDCTYLR